MEENNLTSEEVIKEGKKVGEDVIRTTLVWTLAGYLTRAIREVVKAVIKQ